jgi:hypothetical protein
MAIDRQAAKTNYVQGASNNAEKLVNNYIRQSGKLDRAKSDAAEALYAAKVQAAIAQKSRQKGLNKVTESEMNAAMQATGAQNYRSGTGRSADKQAKNVEPYYAALDSLEGKYPARTADPMQNLTNRAGLVVKTLSDLKKRIG